MSVEINAKYYTELHNNVKYLARPLKPVIPSKDKPELYRKYADRLEIWVADNKKFQEHNQCAATKKSQIRDDFMNWSLVHCGIQTHPKAGTAWAMAWDRGHSMGFEEIFSELEDLAELMKTG